MVERFVFLKLIDEEATPAGRQAIRAEVERVFPGLPGVRGVRVGFPADEVAAAAWDVVLIVRFDRVEDTRPYAVHPDHRAFVDEFLPPRVAVRKAWSFDVAGGESAAR